MSRFPPYTSSAVHLYLSERRYHDPSPHYTVARTSINDSDFQGVPTKSKEVFSYQCRDTNSSVVLGKPLKYQGLEPSWPSWGVCRTSTDADGGGGGGRRRGREQRQALIVRRPPAQQYPPPRTASASLRGCRGPRRSAWVIRRKAGAGGQA